MRSVRTVKKIFTCTKGTMSVTAARKLLATLAPIQLRIGNCAVYVLILSNHLQPQRRMSRTKPQGYCNRILLGGFEAGAIGSFDVHKLEHTGCHTPLCILKPEVVDKIREFIKQHVDLELWAPEAGELLKLLPEEE